jgi:predicted dehydrogenase
MQRREFLAAAMTSAAMARGVSAAEPAVARIKVGQIGTGHGHAAGKMSTMRKLSDLFDVVGVVEPDLDQRKRVQQADAYTGVPWLSEEELLKTPGLKAVAVETEVRDLVPTATRCVKAGLHVHLDKPAGESLTAFQALLDAVRQQNVVVQMGYMFRSNPAFRFTYKAVREGWLGRVFEVHAVMSKQVGDAERKQLAEYPGGSMFELGCHLIDSLTTLMGKPDRITPFGRNTHPDRDSLADNQLAVFEYPAATATIRSSMLEPFGGERRHFTVCGEEGTIEIYPLEPSKLRMALLKPREGYKRGWQDVELPKSAGRYDDEFRALAKIVRGEMAPEWTAAHDLIVQESVLRASGVAVD